VQLRESMRDTLRYTPIRGGGLSSNYEDSMTFAGRSVRRWRWCYLRLGKGKWSHRREVNSDRSVMLTRTCGYASGELSRKIDVKRTTFVFAMVLMHN